MAPTNWLRSLSWLACAAAWACAGPSRVPVLGPDGTPMFHVSCGANEAKCFELAGSACPSGYDMLPTPGKNYLVRCRSAARAPGASSPNVEATTLPGIDAALAPNPYPVPPPTAAAAPSAAFPPLAPAPARAPAGDVGY